MIKIPSKRGPEALRVLLNDYADHREEGEYFGGYYLRKSEDHFYKLLKPLADLKTLVDSDFVDWEQDVKFETAIGIGECAGVKIDLIATLLFESDEKLVWSKEMFDQGHYADSIYHSYNVFIGTAKALLLDKGIACNTQISIINDFDKNFVTTGLFELGSTFKAHVLKINQHEPSKEFAERFHLEAKSFLGKAQAYRESAKRLTDNLLDAVTGLANAQK